MLWRCRWIFLLQSRRRLLPPTSPSPSIRNLHSRPLPNVIDNTEPPESHLGRRGKLSLTPRVVQSTLSSCPSDLIALRFFLWCASQPNYFHDRSSFQFMVSVLVRLTDRCKLVSGVVNQLKIIGYVVKAQNFFILMRIYWIGGLFELVLETYAQMESFGFSHNTFSRNVFMDVLFKIGRADLALQSPRETKVPNFLTFNIALCNLCKKNDCLNARDVIRSMLERGLCPSKEVLEMLLRSFCSVGSLSEASQVLSLMHILGVSISVNTWNILIDGYCRIGRLHLAELLMQKMQQTGQSPNVVIYTTLIKGYLKSQMVSEAFRILRTMELKGIKPDLVLCNVLIDCLSENALYDHALSIFHNMSKWNLAPDSYTFSSLLSTIINSRRFSHFPMLMKGFEPDLVFCNSLLSYYCKAGLPSLAVELYDEMVDAGLAVDKYSLVGLLNGLCGARKINEAVCVYRGIVMKDPGIDAHVHATIMHGLIRAGAYHLAVRLFEKAVTEDSVLDGVSYTVAIHGLFLGGRSNEASALFDKMKEIGLYPNAHTYNVMISGFCKEKDGKMVVKILKEMIDAGIPLTPDSLLRITNFLSRSCYGKSVSGLLVEVRDLSRCPSTASFSCGFSEGVHISDIYPFSSGDSLGSSSSTDTSCSEDICDMAASVG